MADWGWYFLLGYALGMAGMITFIVISEWRGR